MTPEHTVRCTVPLTAKQERFARLVALEGLNQSEAYRQAYNVSPDTLADTVCENASHLASNTNVAPRIQELKASLVAAAVTDAAKILTELAKAGHGDAAGPLRWSDKVAALDKMAKILGLYKEADSQLQRPAAITQVTVVLHQAGAAPRVVDMPVSAPKPVMDDGEVTDTAPESLEAPGIES